MLKHLSTCLLAGLVATAVVRAQNADTPRDINTLGGVFSAAQAERGQQAFLANCARCHRADLGGQNARPLKGTYFLDHWREFKLGLLFNQIRANMPPPNERRGEISDQQYLDIITFILQGNGLPSGPRDLEMSQLDTVTLVGPAGHQPPPSSSMVHLVACFVQIGDNAFGLAKSSRPIRTLLTEMTPDERTAAANWTTGVENFYLQSIDVIDNFIPEQHLNSKVHAKGYLILQPNRERINLTALEVLDDDCQ